MEKEVDISHNIGVKGGHASQTSKDGRGQDNRRRRMVEARLSYRIAKPCQPSHGKKEM